LLYSLKTFHEQFILRFSSDLDNFQDVERFKEAKNLIEKALEFVSEYTKNTKKIRKYYRTAIKCKPFATIFDIFFTYIKYF